MYFDIDMWFCNVFVEIEVIFMSSFMYFNCFYIVVITENMLFNLYSNYARFVSISLQRWSGASIWALNL